MTQKLRDNSAPSQRFVEAMDAICAKAQAQNCRIWIDAEQQAVQAGIDRWTIDYMRKWNKGGKALVYNTLQAYLKTSRSKLKEQLVLASSEGWMYAAKLVRGAYIANEQRDLIHDTKADTDDSYNGIVRDILSGRNLGFGENSFPSMQLFIAGHNQKSVTMALRSMQDLSEQGALKVVPDFGQLQGMADELGSQILDRASMLGKHNGQQQTSPAIPRVYKCLTWGSIQECMQYLVRRAVENAGGTGRMKDGTRAYAAEVRRRIIGI